MKTILIFLCLVCVACGQDKPSMLAVDTITGAKTNIFTVTIKGKPVTLTDYQSTRNETWRIVTDGKTLDHIFFSGSSTYCTYKLIECKTLDIATNEIARLGLKLTDEQKDEIRRLVAEQARAAEKPKEPLYEK